MALLSQSINFIPSDITSQEYKGIGRVYFPKWEGWWYVDSQLDVPNTVVEDFYNIYFWQKLNGDLIKSQEIANLLFVFSILAGKKKALSKLKRVLNVDSISDIDTIEVLNSHTDSDYIFLYLYAEMLELLIISKSSTYSLLSCYYDWLSKSRALTS
jgi:lysozyme family protein